MFFAMISSPSGGSRVHIICRRERRHSSRPSHCMAASDPDTSQPAPSARCDRHEARAGTVAVLSCCLVRLSIGSLGPLDEISLILSLPACTQQTICRGAALASRLDPLASRGHKRRRSKALNPAVLSGASVTDPEPVNFTAGQKPHSPLA